MHDRPLAGDALAGESYADEPLAGRTMVVTRATHQASTLANKLAELGAEVIEVPTIAIVEAADGGRGLNAALDNVDRADWLVITSANGAARVLAAAPDLVARLAVSGTRLALIGSGTAAAMATHGVEPDLVPERFVAEGLLDVFPEPPAEGAKVVLAQAAGARPVLAEGLAAAGWVVEKVDAYRTIHPEIPDDLLAATASAQAITFTSASTVRGWVRVAGIAATPPIVASIGPVTTAQARELGLTVTTEADPHTIDGLIDALTSVLGASD